jgi:hypothetical protein
MGYWLDDLDSNPDKRKFVSLFHSVQAASGARSASYPADTGDDFPWGYSGHGVKLTTELHLVPMWGYTSNPT